MLSEAPHPDVLGPQLDLSAMNLYAEREGLPGMEVHLTPEQEAQLQQIAHRGGKADAGELVKEAALRLLEEDARFRAAVREGMAQADRGEFIEEEEMDSLFEQMMNS